MFICEKCSISFKTKYTLNRHQNNSCKKRNICQIIDLSTNPVQSTSIQSSVSKKIQLDTTISNKYNAVEMKPEHSSTSKRIKLDTTNCSICNIINTNPNHEKSTKHKNKCLSKYSNCIQLINTAFKSRI